MLELFKGNKSLFEGLHVYDKWDWTKTFPVIHLDLSDADSTTSDNLKVSLEFIINDVANIEDLSLANQSIFKIMFNELIRKLYKKTGKKIVVLIDEYDKPIIDNISNYVLAEANRKILKRFLWCFKIQ